MPGVREAAPARFGVWSGTALVVGHTVGVGVFLTPATLIDALRSPYLILGVWLACAALVFSGALAFGELAARFPRAGGPYVYIREAWGEQPAFLYGWQCLLVMDPGVSAALAAGLSDYIVAAWPGVGNGRTLSVLMIWVLALANMGGLRLSARVLSALTAVKVLALATVVALAFSSSAGSLARLAEPDGLPGMPRLDAVALALISAFFAFGGFWEASRMAGEARQANRTLARSLAAGVATITAIYVVTTLAFLYLVPPGVSADAAEFTRRAGLAMAGSAGPRLLAAVVLVSVMASLAALLVMAPRLYVAMSRDGSLPRRLAPPDTRSDNSRAGTVILAGLATLYATVGSFQQIVAFFFCTALAFVALAVAGLFVLRGRARSPVPADVACPGYPLTPASFVVLVLAVLLMVAVARPLQAFAGAGIVLLGIPVYRALKARGALARPIPQGAKS